MVKVRTRPGMKRAGATRNPQLLSINPPRKAGRIAVGDPHGLHIRIEKSGEYYYLHVYRGDTSLGRDSVPLVNYATAKRHAELELAERRRRNAPRKRAGAKRNPMTENQSKVLYGRVIQWYGIAESAIKHSKKSEGAGVIAIEAAAKSRAYANTIWYAGTKRYKGLVSKMFPKIEKIERLARKRQEVDPQPVKRKKKNPAFKRARTPGQAQSVRGQRNPVHRRMTRKQFVSEFRKELRVRRPSLRWSSDPEQSARSYWSDGLSVLEGVGRYLKPLRDFGKRNPKSKSRGSKNPRTYLSTYTDSQTGKRVWMAILDGQVLSQAHQSRSNAESAFRTYGLAPTEIYDGDMDRFHPLSWSPPKSSSRKRRATNKNPCKNPPVGRSIAMAKIPAHIKSRADFKRMVTLYKQQHGVAPKSMTLYDAPGLGNPKDMAVLASMGRAPDRTYTVPRGSKKRNVAKTFIHEYETEPEIATDGRITIDLPRSAKTKIKADGWMHG